MIQFPTLPPSTSDEALLLQLIALRRQRKEIDMRIRELSGVVARDPNARPCECLRCGYTWYPKCADITPKCCSQCGSEHWDIPPTATSRRPGDPPAPSWTKRRKRKERRPPPPPLENGESPQWRGPDAPMLLSEQYMPPSPAAAHVAKVAASFPPPPDIRTVLPPPPDPAQVSLSARLAQYCVRDESPEQPERTVSLPPTPPVYEGTKPEVSDAAIEILNADELLDEAIAADEKEDSPVWPTTRSE